MLSKKQIYIAVAVLLFIVILAIYFYRKGKNTVTLQYLPNDLPGNPGSNTPVGASNDEIKTIANTLYEDMSGFNIWGHNYEPYNRAVLFSDTDLVKLYNAYNALYQKDSQQTLTQWITNEQYTFPETPFTIINRLKKLNAL